MNPPGAPKNFGVFGFGLVPRSKKNGTPKTFYKLFVNEPGQARFQRATQQGGWGERGRTGGISLHERFIPRLLAGSAGNSG